MKIPTLIGVTLIIALVASYVLFFYRQKPETARQPVVSDLQALNIFDTAATIVWETDTPTIGGVVFGENENLNQKAADNRDRGQPQARVTHFVTLNNLKPATKYFYKIGDGSSESSEKNLTFTTAAGQPSSDELSFSFLKPLKGTILNVNLNPIDESLIFLNLNGAEKMATFSSTAGNFILPLRQVYNSKLDQLFSIPPDSPATLTIKKGPLQSEVKILISDTTVNLPPLTIGNNLDLTKYKPQPISVISINSNGRIKLDFNHDGIINSLDLAILRGKIGSKQILKLDEQALYDVNSDGLVNQKDVDEFSKALTGD